jgi:type I restriction-modification system DNA methylase subunit
VEEKPEVRKAGGVYYTPQYIVNYIVENTIGALLQNKAPKTLKNFRLVDPACGSGSFLINAYQYLLNWYLREYTKAPEQYKKQCVKTGERNGAAVYKLSINERKRILTGHIFGVDIDAQAVEVTKLSLLLKALEGLNEQEIQKELFNERVLPDLSRNIKCGNSLIGPDCYVQGTLDLSDDDQYRINAFDWEREFADVFKDGGFDAVIGNPPYVLVFEENSKKYIEDRYPQFQRNNDLYVAFIVKGISLLKQKGYFSFITPNTYLKGDYFKPLRAYLIQFRINEVVDFGIKLVFKNVNVFTAITNITKENPINEWTLKSDIDVVRGKINSSADIFIAGNALVEKLDKCVKFEDALIIKDVGYNYWSIGRGKVRGDSIGSRVLYSGIRENAKDIPYYKGSNIHKYLLSNPSQYLRHNYHKFLKENDIFRFTPELLETKPKIIYRQTSSSLIGAIDTEGYHNDKTVHLILLKDNTKVDLKYVLALFNSKLLNYYYQVTTEEQGRAFAQVKTGNVKKLPFIVPDKAAHDKLVALVDQMLVLKKKEQAEAVPQTKTMISRQIQAVDKQIDALVYRLYGLTEDEIKVVEGEG